MSLKNPRFTVKFITAGGVIAALYIALTALFAPISFGAIQFRVSEALTLLPILTPAAVPGLFIGCLLSNLVLGSPWQDVIIGSLASLLAAFLTRTFRRSHWLAALMPVLMNGLLVGGMLSVVLALPFWATASTVALGEAAVVYMLGIPLIQLMQKRFGDKLSSYL